MPTGTLTDLHSLVDDIRELRPISVSAETRALALACKAAKRVGEFLDEAGIEEWAWRLVDSVVDLDD